MEWEKRFYDILRDTESNLASARRKLQGKCLSKDANKSLDELDPAVWRRYGTMQTPAMSSSLWNTGAGAGGLLLHTHQTQAALAVPPPTTITTTTTTPSFSSPLLALGPRTDPFMLSSEPRSEMGELMSKIDSQNMMINRLEHLVRTLNQEKDHYRRHISDLQYSVGDMNLGLKESQYVSPHLESQMDLMRHEVRSDMQRLQNLITAVRGSSLQSAGLQRSFTDMQHDVHAELEGIRRDLNSMSHRIGRLELDVSSYSVGQRDLHERLQTSLRTSPYTSLLGSRGPLYLSSQPPAPPQMSKLENLRSVVSDLHGKLDSLEGQLTTSSSTPLLSLCPRRMPTSLRKPFKRPSLSSCKKCSLNDDDDDDDDDDESCILDDLDLSDLDLSSDNDDDDDDDADDVSDDVEDIVRRVSREGVRAVGRTPLTTTTTTPTVTLDDLDLSASDDLCPTVSSADLSDLDLDNLDLSSDDLGSGTAGSFALKMDDL